MAKILVVDDEREILDLMEIYLTKKGFQVVKCDNGEGALGIVDKDKEIDLIVLDIRMPGLDGKDVFNELKRRQCKLPIIILTGSMGKDHLGLEAEGCLLKPIDLDDLMDKINRLLGK